MLPITSCINLPSPSTVTVDVDASHPTLAPIFSEINLTGTKVLSFFIKGTTLLLVESTGFSTLSTIALGLFMYNKIAPSSLSSKLPLLFSVS